MDENGRGQKKLRSPETRTATVFADVAVQNFRAKRFLIFAAQSILVHFLSIFVHVSLLSIRAAQS